MREHRKGEGGSEDGGRGRIEERGIAEESKARRKSEAGSRSILNCMDRLR